MNKEEIEKAKEELQFFNEGDYITKNMANSARVLEDYIQQLEFNIKASKKEHNHDVSMIDEVKGVAVKLYKERDKLKEELEMYKDIKEVANMKLDRLTNPIQQLEVNVMLDRQCKNLKAILDKVTDKLNKNQASDYQVLTKTEYRLRKMNRKEYDTNGNGRYLSDLRDTLLNRIEYQQEILNIIEGEKQK